MSSEFTIVIPSTTLITIGLLVFIYVIGHMTVAILSRVMQTDLRYYIELYMTFYVWQRICPFHQKLTFDQLVLLFEIRNMDPQEVRYALASRSATIVLAKKQVADAQAMMEVVSSLSHKQPHIRHNNTSVRDYHASN